MKVLMISGDAGVLDASSAVAKRMVEYGRTFGSLDILLCRGSIFNFISGFFRGLKMIRQKRPDVITAQSPEHALFAWIFSKIYRVPWQMQIHTDIFSPYFAGSPASPAGGSVFNKIRVLLVKFLIPRASGVRVVSERIKSSLMAYGVRPTAVSVLPIFLDVKKIKNTPVKIDLHQKYPGKFIILMPTRVTKEKNIEMALEAIRRLTQIDGHPRGSVQINQRESALLLIVGDGPEKEHLKEFAHSLKLGDNVVFEPAVDFETLISYYKTADLYLLTSFYEGWPLAPMEALASGLPVVMTDVAPGHIMDGANGIVVPIGDSRELALKISQLVENPGQLAQLKKGAENSFPTPLSKEKYLELYTKLLKDLISYI